MKSLIYNKMIVTGLLLMLAGVIGPLVMVLQIVEPNFPLCFLSYSASLLGLFLGAIGITQERRHY